MQSLPQLIEVARELRKQQTNAEELLWKIVRKRQLKNAKFRRQHPIENYITDFYCHEYKLIIELDGSQHFTPEGVAKDKIRTERFNELGIQVLRFENRKILLQTEKVLEEIYRMLTPLSPLPREEGT